MRVISRPSSVRQQFGIVGGDQVDQVLVSASSAV